MTDIDPMNPIGETSADITRTLVAVLAAIGDTVVVRPEHRQPMAVQAWVSDDGSACYRAVPIPAHQPEGAEA